MGKGVARTCCSQKVSPLSMWGPLNGVQTVFTDIASICKPQVGRVAAGSVRISLEAPSCPECPRW
jgi:hypothetical protein